MTFNLRYASADGPHSWADRRPVVRALLDAERPDLICTQEGLAGQLDDVMADLGSGAGVVWTEERRERSDWSDEGRRRHRGPGARARGGGRIKQSPAYGFIGTGRDGGTRGEYTAILYRIERLTPVRDGVFWLSGTPDVVGSNTWGARCVRMATWARFRDAVTGREFCVVNTHLDHISERARQRSAALIRDRIAALASDVPVVLAGDFNAPAGADSPTYEMLTGGLVDTWTAAATRGPAYSTWHGFGPVVVDGPRIDWILVTPDIAVEEATVNPFRDGDRFPSDHLPVQVRLRLPAVPQ